MRRLLAYVIQAFFSYRLLKSFIEVEYKKWSDQASLVV